MSKESTLFNLEYVTNMVGTINDRRGDCECAHVLEDGLYLKLVTFVSMYSTDEDAKALAKEVLKTQDIDFERWCA